MNIALCFYGQPRFYEITYKEYFKSIIETYNADVFIHTWWDENMVGKLYPCAPHAVTTLSDEDRTINPNLVEKLKYIYNPKVIQYDNYDTVDIKNRKSNYYQYYTQYAVKELLSKYELENDIEYDLVIRTRFDLLIRQYIPYRIDGNIWISNTSPYNDRYNDLFSFSNSKNYKKLSDVYLNLEEFEEKNKGEMEWALISQIQKENIPVKLFDAEYATFDILRTQTANQYR